MLILCPTSLVEREKQVKQTLKLTIRTGYVESVCPWPPPNCLVSMIPEDSNDSWRKIELRDYTAVQLLNKNGWTTITVFPSKGMDYDKEIWLTREVDESAAPAG